MTDFTNKKITEINKKGLKCPLSQEVIRLSVAYKYYKPNKLFLILKDKVKHLINYHTKIPSLYYNHKIDFAFFPRPADIIMDKLYGDKKNSAYETLDIDNEILNVKSKSRNLGGHLIWQFIEETAKKINHDIKNVLDFGAGTGWLSLFLSDLKLNVTATDISSKVMRIIPLVNKKINCLPLKSLRNEPEFDLILSYDVFEHLKDPVKELSILTKNLNSNGLIFISVPNFSSYFNKINISKHPYFVYPDHLNYFTYSSIKLLCERAGLKFLRCETTTLDWEKDYIRREYTNDETGLKGYRFYDKWSEPGNGERLFCIAQK